MGKREKAKFHTFIKRQLMSHPCSTLQVLGFVPERISKLPETGALSLTLSNGILCKPELYSFKKVCVCVFYCVDFLVVKGKIVFVCVTQTCILLDLMHTCLLKYSSITMPLIQ